MPDRLGHYKKKEHINNMTTGEKAAEYQTAEIGTPRDYSEEVVFKR